MAWVRVENEMSGKDGFKKPLGLNIPPPIRELGCQKNTYENTEKNLLYVN